MSVLLLLWEARFQHGSSSTVSARRSGADCSETPDGSQLFPDMLDMPIIDAGVPTVNLDHFAGDRACPALVC